MLCFLSSHFHSTDQAGSPNFILLKTEKGASWKYEKVQVGLVTDHFIFALKSGGGAQVCLLYDPGYVEDDAGWCVTIGQNAIYLLHGATWILRFLNNPNRNRNFSLWLRQKLVQNNPEHKFFMTRSNPHSGGDNNTYVKIRQNLVSGDPKNQTNAPGILDPTSYLDFWITW